MTRGAHFDWPTTTFRVAVRHTEGTVEHYGPFRKIESAEITVARVTNTAIRRGTEVTTEIQVCRHRWDTVQRS